MRELEIVSDIPLSNTCGPISETRLSQAPLPRPTLGAWGFAHVTASWTLDGRPRLVGRELESIRLLNVLDSVLSDHEPYLVTVSGPARVGKTRLIEEMLVLARVSGFEERIFSVAARPSDAKNALLERLLRARFRLTVDAEPEHQKALLAEQLREILSDERVDDVCVLLGNVLGLHFDESPPSRLVYQDPFNAELALESLVCELVSADAAQAPLCLVLEDLQYADPDSLAAVAALCDQLGGAALVVCSARSEFFSRHEQFCQGSPARFEHLELHPLEPVDARALLDEVLGPLDDSDGSADMVTHQLLDASLGSPGLLLELSSELWASGTLCADSARGTTHCRSRRLRLRGDWDERIEVVETRLQALSPDQHGALAAASLAGSAFWPGLFERLLQASDVPAPRVTAEQCLDALTRAGHLLRLDDSRFEGQVEYVFRRPVERELLRSSLSSSRRRAGHRVIAEWLDARAETRRSSELLALLAEQLHGAGSAYRAALALLDAGEVARREGAMLRATQWFEQGLKALGDQDDRRRIDAVHGLGAALVDLGQPDRARHAFEEMLGLAERLELANKRGAALNRLGRLSRDEGDLAQARRYFEHAANAFEQARDRRGLSATQDDLGKLLWLDGDHQAAFPLLRAGLEERKVVGDRRSVAVSLSTLALAWDEQGKARRADEALDIADELFRLEHDERGTCDALLARGTVAACRREHTVAERSFSQAGQLAEKLADHARLARALMNLGCTKLRRNDLAAAEPLLDRAAEVAESVHAWLTLAETRRALAKLQLKRRRLDLARRQIRASLHLARRTKSRAQLAATLRTLADVAASGAWGTSTAERAARFYVHSIELAKETANELEIAKGYDSFARYADRFSRPEIRRQAELLHRLAEDIFSRWRGARAGT